MTVKLLEKLPEDIVHENGPPISPSGAETIPMQYEPTKLNPATVTICGGEEPYSADVGDNVILGGGVMTTTVPGTPIMRLGNANTVTTAVPL